MLTDTLAKFQFDLNQSGDVRLLDSSESGVRDSSYLNKLAMENKTRLNRTLNGFKDFS